MQCLICGAENPERAKFCIACAAPFTRRCTQCRTDNPPQAKFCAECGESLVEKSKGKRQKAKIKSPSSKSQSLNPRAQSSAERRQLTVMFCDLVDSTALSARLDPEDLRDVLRRYQETCAAVILRFDGYIAQYLGDGLLVYFGYPRAHEDDAARAVRAGLDVLSSIQKTELHVRVGIHTGPVVISEIGSTERRELLALGETPNIAARVQGHATPNTVVISAATQHLVHGLFECQELGTRPLKGISTPLSLYHVVSEAAAHSRFEVAVQRGLTPLVGREYEVGLLSERWERAKQAEGQVVLLSGEPGIGKSRLVEVMREQAEKDAALRVKFRCSPYHQNSAFYPIIEHLHRLLHFAPHDSPPERLRKLAQTLTSYRFPQADTVPLLAALLSLPQPAHSPTLTVSPQRQKQKTQEVLVAWLVEDAERHAVYCPWEDLHWADPSTLELLGRLIEQIPTTRLFLLLTSRPEFTPPWGQHGHFSQLTLSRLGRRQVPRMIAQATGGKTLSAEVIQQIVAKTDGVPLFVEELTKMVVEGMREQGTGGGGQAQGMGESPPAAPLSLAIPATLQDALMARLDRLGAVKEIAQVGATLGREFSYELLHAVLPGDESKLQQGLSQLVAVELLYQRGTPPQSTYLFKHALIQDTAYQSVLKSRRQQLHQQIAQVLEERFAGIKATQPELLAHHYTEASRVEQAIPYWQQAGQRAIERSANTEAVSHLTKSLELLKLLPDTHERAHQELTLQTALGPALIATKGFGAPETGKTYTRARELCRQVGETPQLFLVLRGLWAFYNTRAELQTAREVGEQCLTLAQGVQDPALLVEAHRALGRTLLDCGELTSARAHLERGINLYDLQQHRSHAFLYGYDPGVAGLSCIALVLWHLGYLDQAAKKIHEALSLAQELAHPFSLAFTLMYNSALHQRRCEVHETQDKAELLITLSQEQGFPVFVGWGNILRGWALVEQGKGQEDGIAQIRQGRVLWQVTGTEMWQSHFLALLAEACREVGQLEEGLSVLAEALTVVDKTGERFYEAELYRLKGQLTLQSKVQGLKSNVEEAEKCFHRAIDVAQQQQAKSWELRAATSLARLWQQQGKRAEAHKLLSEVYNWFTEGFDTKDLQEAKDLLDELSH